MKLLLGIATYKREEKLRRCLQSILKNSYKNWEVVVIADNKDYGSALTVNSLALPNVIAGVQDRQGFVIGAWNKVVQENIHRKFDAFIGFVDDIELYPNALEEIVKSHKQDFPDTDGVVGFAQECPGHPEYSFKWFGQTLIGRKFIERYQTVNYQVCCPFYQWSHQDEELFQYANSLGKFKECPEAILNHYHPCFLPQEMDLTHQISREGKNNPRTHDLQLFKQRQKEGKLWPLS